jgi:hypothetical protein
VAEWFKAAVLKTVDRKIRGFESYLLRQFSVLPVGAGGRQEFHHDNLRLQVYGEVAE